mgnify:CR=1 FL=1
MEALKPASEINGADLVRRARSGDGAAWEEIVTAFSRRIFNLAYRFTSNADAAEDLTQDVFIRIYRTLDQYDPKQGDLANWLMRLARNLIIDDYRHRQRNPQNTMADAVDDHQYHLRAVGTSAHRDLERRERDGAFATDVVLMGWLGPKFLAAGTLAVRDGLRSEVPSLDPRPVLTMADMGHGGHADHGRTLERQLGRGQRALDQRDDRDQAKLRQPPDDTGEEGEPVEPAVGETLGPTAGHAQPGQEQRDTGQDQPTRPDSGKGEGGDNAAGDNQETADHGGRVCSGSFFMHSVTYP